MSDPPKAPKPANATIEIDKSDLDEILNAMPSAATLAQASVPPPLPPEEIARARSMAPVQPTSQSPHSKPSLLPYVLISLALMLVAGVAAGVILYSHGSHSDAVAPVASTSPTTIPESSASAATSAAAPAGTTLTIHTVELGGKSSE